MEQTVSKLHDLLEDIKAEDIAVINVSKMTNITDFIVICTGRSKRHTYAIADHIKMSLKATTGTNIRVQGLETCEWVIVDLNNIVLHVMQKHIREFYQLEKLWDENLIIENSK